MKVLLGITCIVLHIIGLNSLIIPDDLPSLLSIIYSNIPTLKKGTDSRVGWGFRLGDRADFQVLVELGPQKFTQPLGNQGGDNTNKRNTINTLANQLYAQRQQEKKIQQSEKAIQEDIKTEKDNVDDSKAGDWLQTWSKTVSSTKEANSNSVILPQASKTVTSSKKENYNSVIPPHAKPGLAIGEIDAKSVIPDDSILDQIEKVTIKPRKTENKPVQKKNIDSHRKLISILTEGAKASSSLPSNEEEKPLDDVSFD